MLEKIKLILNFKLSFAAVIGISAATVFNLTNQISSTSIFVLSLFLILIILVSYHQKYKSLISFCAFFIVGIASSTIYNQYYRVYPVNSVINEEKVWVKGIITDIKFKNKYAKVTLKNIDIYTDMLTQEEQKKIPYIIIATFRSRVTDAKIGDEMVSKVMLRVPKSRSFADDFDYKSYLLQNKTNLIAQVRGGIYITPPENGYSIIEQILNYRISLTDKIQNNYKENPEVAGITMALITGMKGDIPKESSENFRNSGLSHLMAISGMHMAFLFGFVFLIVRYLLCFCPNIALNFSSKKIACVVGLVFAGFYLILAGASLPTIRAFSMILMFSITILINRTKITLHSLCVIAILILIFNPMAIFSASFHLSFVAVFAILLYNQSKKEELVIDYSKFSKFVRGFSNIVNISIVAFCATMFFVASHFGYISIFSIFANIVSSILMTFFVMPALITYYIGFLVLNINIFSTLNEFSISALNSVAQYFAEFSNSSVYISPEYSFVLLFVSIIVISLIVFNVRFKYLLSFVILFVSFIIPIKFDLKPQIIPINNAIAIRKDNSLTVLGNIEKRNLKKLLQFYKLKQTNINLPKTCDISGCIYKINNKKILQMNEEFSSSPEDLNLVDYVVK